MRNYIFRLLIVVCILALPYTQSHAATINSVTVDPDLIGPDDSIFASFLIEFETTGFEIDPVPTIDIVGNQIHVSIFASSPTGIVLPVFVSQTFTTTLGMLAVGDYDLIGALYIDGEFTDSISTGFSVTVVPVPAAIWLFGAGLGLLFGFAKRRK